MSQVNIAAVSDAGFSAEVLNSAQPVLVKFEADWCGPCQAMKPAVAELADEYAGKVKVLTLDIDQNQQTPYKYGIRGVPTVLLFDRGQVVGQRVGLARKADLAALLEQKLDVAAAVSG